jgi:nucleoid-associated protein YgaU
MSVRRLLLTTTAMAAVAVALVALTPGYLEIAEALSRPQQTVDRTGADTLVLAGAGVLAWLCWGWGALGLALTAASALPGLLGRAARTALQVVLPAGARRSAALLLGLGLGVAGPVVATALHSAPTASAAVVTTTVGPAPDWPGTPVPDRPGTARDSGAGGNLSDGTAPDWPAGGIPDRPPSPGPGAHVVVRGDCLWSIAENRLQQERDRAPSASEVAAAVQAWWTANRTLIGPDPDRLLPGQVLLPPDSP